MTRLAWPVRLLRAGRLATVTDGSPAAVEQDARLVLQTVVGDRVAQPAFGRPDWTLRRGGVSTEEALAVLAEHLPETDVDVLQDLLTRDSDGTWVRRLGLGLSNQITDDGEA